MSSGINNSVNAGQAYNNWTRLASEMGEKTPSLIVSSKEVNSTEFLGDFVELTKSYIGEYDTNGDGAISYDEFKAKELNMAKENGTIEPDEAELKRAFDRLNVVKDGEYANELSQKEIFSYFMGMDSLKNQDGKISYDEFAMMALSLTDKSDAQNSPGVMVESYLKDTYNSIFGE